MTFKVEPTNCKTYASIARTNLTDSAHKQSTFSEGGDVPAAPDPIKVSTIPNTPFDQSGLTQFVPVSQHHTESASIVMISSVEQSTEQSNTNDVTLP